jgi:hypothetical protein
MKELRKNNARAPRFAFKSIRCLGDSNFFKKFIKKHPEHIDKVNAKFITKVIRTFNRLLWREVILNRAGALLPERLGHLVMKSFPIKDDFINYGLYYREGITVAERNISTEGKMLKICFNNSDKAYNYTNKELWYFEPERKFSQEASKAFIIDWSKYEYVDNSRFEIATRANKIKAKEFSILKTEEFLLTYNEFAFD